MFCRCTIFPSSRRASANRFLRLVLPAILLALPIIPAVAARAHAAQQDGRAVLWVYFSDKGETDAASLRRAVAEAGARVSVGSRARRTRLTGGRFLPDYTDVPTLPRYVRSIESTGASVRHVSRWLNAVSVEVDDASARKIATLPFVRLITPVLRSEPQLGPPGSYGGSSTQNLGINAIAAHDSGYSAAGVVVAIFDTGFRKDHAALAPLKRIAEWDFVGSDGETANQSGDDATQWNHGTGVWSILGGYLPGTLVGPAFNASFVLAKTKDVTRTATVDEDRWVAAAQWADSIGVDIVQSSMVVAYPVGSLNGKTTPMALATSILSRHGILVVTAMGNTGPAATTLWTPSDCDSILAVGSVTSSNVISSFSSRGPTADGRGKPDLVAQGENTIWAVPSCTTCTGTYPGTSLAAPLVSGAAALVQEAHPEWSSQQVRYALKSTADKAGSADSTTYGWGRPNVVAAIYNSTLGGPVFPKPFPLLAPASGFSSAASPLAFRWRRAIDLNPGDAVSYTLQIRKVSPSLVVFTTSIPDTSFSYSGSLDAGVLYEWSVVATDLGGHARPSQEPFRFTAAGSGTDRAPTATAPATAGGPENALLSFSVTATDPDGDAISALTAAPLPAGATFTPNGTKTAGTYSWTPSFTQAGLYNVTFTASNALSGTATTAITISNVNRAPVLNPIAAISVAQGATATRTLVASDPDGDAVTLSKFNGPAFASVTGSTLTTSPASSDSGAYTVVVRATDGSLNADQPVSVTVTTASQAPPPAGGPVAAYAFDEGSGTITADLSGYGHPGTLTNGPTWVAGKYGSALSFNATDDGNDANDPRVVLGRTLNIPNLPFTFSTWVNPASFADWRAMLSKRDSPSASNMRCDLGLAASTGRVYLSTGSTFRSFVYSPPLNTWTHLAVVAETGGTKLYVNGVLRETIAAVTLGTGTNANVVIGGTGEALGGDDDPFKGLLDDMRLYDRAQTQTEIQTDMNTPAGVPDTQPPTVSLTAPPAGTVSGAAVTVSASASDNIVVAGVQFKLDGANLGAEDTTAPYSIVWNSTLVTDGSHTLTAVARDATGNGATSAGVIVTTSNPPTLTITQPTNGSTLTGTTTVNVSYTTGGNLTGVDHVHFQLDANPIVMDLTLDGSYQLTGVSAGSHVLNGFLVTADHTKIPGTDAVPVSFTTTVPDTTRPTVSITSPAPSSTVSGTITITANAGDNIGVLGVQFKAGATNIIPEDTTAPYSVSFNTTTFPNGPLVLTAVARDAAGNQTTSSGVSVTVSNLNPNDPSVVGQWSAPFAWPNVAVHLTLMSDGNLLTWDDHSADDGSHVFNPTTNTFISTPYSAANLFCAGHVALPDGRILVNGGHTAAYVGIPGTVLFTPSTRTWTAVAPMTYARWYPTTIALPDGRILTVSGAINCPDCRTPGGPDAGIADIPEIYNPVTNAWTQLNSASKNFPIYPHVFVLPDGKIIATSTQEDPIPTVMLDINTQTWTTVDPAVVDGGSSVMYLPGKFMKSGAAINPDYPALPSNAATHVLDMTSGPSTWRTTAPMAFPRTQHNLTILPDGNVLVTGGSRNSNVFDQNGAVFEAELWSPTTETYTTLAGNQVPRLYHSTALLLPDGRVISTGGGRFGPSHLDGEFYSPPYLFKGPRPTITAAPTLLDYGTNFIVTTPDAGRIAKVSLIKVGSVTHAINSEQRFVPLTFQVGSGILTVQTPTSRNVAPPGFYMLFIVDTNGVPAVAPFVRFPSPAEDLTPPTAPTNLTATGSVGSASLGWTGSSDNVGVAAYDVHRSTSSGFTPSPATKVGSTTLTSFADTGIPAATYFYKVLARDAAGNSSSPSNQATATVTADLSAPTVPLGLVANPVSPTQINLTWSASTDNVRVAGYHVRRNGAVVTTTTLTAFSDTGVSASTTYSYTVDAFDDAGNTSAPSAPASVTTPAVPPVGANLVASYAFDEGSGTTTADLSGLGHPGTLTNGPIWTAGKYGNALLFNATDDGNDSNDPRVVVGPNLNIPNLPFTFSAWVNPAGYADWRAILSKRNTSTATNMRLDVGLSGGSGRVYLATGATFRSFVYAPPVNVWTNLAVVAEATGTKLYVNGVLQETVAAITLGSNTLANTVIGGTGEAAGGDNDPYKGLLDDLRLYDRALTQPEIQTDMNTPAGTADTQPPTVSITAPAAGTVSGTAVTVSANASDDVTVAGVQFKLDGVNLGAEDTAAPYSIVWNSTGATNGTHALTAVARDGAGHTTTSAAVSVTVSNPPVLTITQPTNGSTVSGTTVNVTYTTSGDMTGVDHVHFQLDANPIVMDLTLDGVYQLTGVATGAHVLNGFLVTAGHTKIPGTDAAPVSFTTTAPDTIPPTVSITAPAASSTLSGTVTITADASDNVGVVGVLFRVGAVDLTPEDTATPFSASFNTTAFPNGTYLLTAVARDAAGNRTTSATVSVTVSNTAISGLVASYSFDEGSGTTTADISGLGHPGTLINGPTWTTGKYVNGLLFNATDDHNDANDPRVVIGPTLDIPNIPFTFSAWVNPAGFADWRAILSKRDSPTAANMRLDVGLSANSGRVYLATGATFRSFVYAPPLNVWTHLAVVAEAGGTKLYVNGNLQETIAAITLGSKTTANTVIGGTGEPLGGDNDPYKGLLDDLRLYNRALAQSEIQTDMNTPVGTQPAMVSQPEPLAASTLETSPPAPAVLRVFPNPFRGTTRIEARGREIAIYDVSGRQVRIWKASAAPTTVLGLLRVDWDGTDHRAHRLPTGVYFVKSGRQIVRVALLR
jgi:uncharacterized membrane protein YphA (DoxX/SURF4 family)